jgi:ankyrin repeat domain-containing protein 50
VFNLALHFQVSVQRIGIERNETPYWDDCGWGRKHLHIPKPEQNEDDFLLISQIEQILSDIYLDSILDMDPLSVTASIIAVIQITDSVLTSCYKYFGKVKNAATDIESIIQEASLLKGILINLQELCEQDSTAAQLRDLLQPNGPISACWEALQELQLKLSPKKNDLTTKQKLIWPFESKKVGKILDRIRQQKPTLLLAITTNTRFVVGNVDSGVQDIQHTLRNTQLQEKREKILNWLQVSDPKDKQRQSRLLHQEGSNAWILESKEFTTWRDTPCQAIWVCNHYLWH